MFLYINSSAIQLIADSYGFWASCVGQRVIYAGDALLSIPLADLSDMDWTFRRALKDQVNKWYNSVVEDPQDRVSIGKDSPPI